MIEGLVRRTRSYRRFREGIPIKLDILRDQVNLARLSASASNLQPLKYILSNDPQTNSRIFPTLGWAGYLKDLDGPADGERPTAYVVILGDTEIRKSFGCDHGIAAQSIMLGMTEQGFGGCMIGSIKRDELRKILEIPEHLEILLVLALGKPSEKVVLDSVGEDGDIKYYRDGQDVHHVPKRSLEKLIIDERGK
jgi:nitroreductase